MVASVVEDFWTTLDHIDDAHSGTLHNPFIVATYLGLRANELAALQRGDVDLAFKQVHIRHNFDRRRRPSTVKSEESETWIQFGTEMSCGSSRRPRGQGHAATSHRACPPCPERRTRTSPERLR